MTTSKHALRLAASAGLLSLAMFGGAAQAAIQEVDPHGFSDVKQMDVKTPEMPIKNKDATISKQQSLEKQGKMSMAQFKPFMNEFKSFGQ